MISLVPLVIQSKLNKANDEGTIVDIRPELGYLGKLELSSFLWLRMTNLPARVYQGLDQKRYKIPFKRLFWLKKIVNFDLNQIRDVDHPYQPFLGKLDLNRYESNGLVIEPWGLIYDNIENIYL